MELISITAQIVQNQFLLQLMPKVDTIIKKFTMPLKTLYNEDFKQNVEKKFIISLEPTLIKFKNKYFTFKKIAIQKNYYLAKTGRIEM